MTNVTVNSSLMGTGKSLKMIEKINNSDSDQRYIIVLPFISECHRYAGTISDPETGEKQKPLKDDKGNIIYENRGCAVSGRRFHHPSVGYNRSKVDDIAELVERGLDIVTTHAALKMFTNKTRDHIKDNGYKLIIDEELECIKPVGIKRERRHLLLNSGVVRPNLETGLLEWTDEDYADGSEEDDLDSTGLSWEQRVKMMCNNGSLLLIEDSKGDRKFFMWEYPVSFITAFDEIEVMTYLFEGSVFQKYLQFHDIPYSVQRGIMLPDDPFNMIRVLDNDKMNRPGAREAALSATHQQGLSKNTAYAETMKKHLTNYFNNSTYGRASMDERMWSCLKGAKSIFQGKGYTKRYVPHNIKAVNDYNHVSKVAYVYNSFLHPDVENHLSKRGLEYRPSSDRFALTELLQNVYRSRVRKDEPINLYIPSQRMRDILEEWMKGGYDEIV